MKWPHNLLETNTIKMHQQFHEVATLRDKVSVKRDTMKMFNNSSRFPVMVSTEVPTGTQEPAYLEAL